MTLAEPYRHDSRTSLALILSVLLHVLLGVAIVGFFIFRPATPPAPSKFFELVAAPPSDNPSEEPAPGPPSLSMPNIPTPSVPSPPQPVEATPQPTPVAVQPPTPTPVPTHAATVVPKPPSKQPALTEHEKFLRDHNINPSAAPARTTGRAVPNVGVNINSIAKNLQNAGSGANGQGRGRANAAASSAEAQDYISSLVARLRDAFVPPGGVSGLNAEIYLEIGPNGELVKKYISRSSGNAEFDAAVNDALKRLTNVDPPPGGIQVDYKFLFTPAS